MKLTILQWIEKYLNKTLDPEDQTAMAFPPPIAKTLGVSVVQVSLGTAILEMKTDLSAHSNPMGTIHGGVLCDIADMAIGTAHATTLKEDESFTSIDLRINFFRPLWNDTIRAHARPVHVGKTVSYYTCDITRSDGKLVATVTSSVMTIRGELLKGRA